MNKPILRKNRDGSYVIYRTKTNQGIILTAQELDILADTMRKYFSNPHYVTDPVVLDQVGASTWSSGERFRQITATDKGIDIGEIRGDLFSD